MKNIIKISILSIFAMFLFSGFTDKVFATSSTVEFQSTPLFGEASFAPGNTITKWIKLNNNTEIAHLGIVKALDVVNDGIEGKKLGDVTNLKIKQGETIIYEGTFSDFFSKSKVDLPQVLPHNSATFDFVVTFDSNSNNEYQNSTMSFSLEAGFEDDTTTDTVSVGSSGSYITVGPKTLLITNEDFTGIVGEIGTIIISWNTNIPATSQVIYGLSSGGPYNLDMSAVNFGYPFSTPEQDLGKVTNHTVYIDNLPAGDYVYRVVSRASPATVGYEHHFVVLGKSNLLNPNINQINGLKAKNQ